MYKPSNTPRKPDFMGETVSVVGTREQAMQKVKELASLVPEGMHRQTFLSRREFVVKEGWWRYEVKVDGWYDPPYPV